MLWSLSHKSGRSDSNRRPLQPHCNALAGLRHAPISLNYSPFRTNWQAMYSISPAILVFFPIQANDRPATAYRSPLRDSPRGGQMWDYPDW